MNRKMRPMASRASSHLKSLKRNGSISTDGIRVTVDWVQPDRSDGIEYDQESTQRQPRHPMCLGATT